MPEFALSRHGLVEYGSRRVEGRTTEEEAPVRLLARLQVRLGLGADPRLPGVLLGLVEHPQGLVVLGGHVAEGTPVQVPQDGKPENVGLLLEV